MNNNKKQTKKQQSYYEKINEIEVLMFGLFGKKYIKCHTNMVRILGGFKEAIFFQQLFFWKDKGADPNGWIYKTKKELEEETAIPRSTQDRVRNKLVKMGLIEVKNKCKKGSSTPVLHYRINTEGVVAMTQNELSAMTQSGSLHKPKVSCSNDPKLTNHIGTEDNTEDNTEESQQSAKADVDKTLKFSEKDLEMATLLANLIKNNNPEWRLKGGIKTWATHIEKLHRIDGRTYEQIEYTIRWTQRDQFWQQNILSTAKLRKQFNNLIPKMKADHERSHTEIIGLADKI